MVGVALSSQKKESSTRGGDLTILSITKKILKFPTTLQIFKKNKNYSSRERDSGEQEPGVPVANSNLCGSTVYALGW